MLFSGVTAVTAALKLTDSASLALSLGTAALLIAMLTFSARRNEPAYIALVSVMTALSVVGRMVFAPLSGFKPCTAIIITAGISLGADAGFICGAFTALVSNIYFGQGTWTLYQMFSWGIVGLLAGLAAKTLSKNRILLYAFGALSGVIYSLLMDIFSVLWEDGYFNPLRFAIKAASSAPVTAVYCVSNILFLILLSDKLCFAVKRVRSKYGI